MFLRILSAGAWVSLVSRQSNILCNIKQTRSKNIFKRKYITTNL